MNRNLYRLLQTAIEAFHQHPVAVRENGNEIIRLLEHHAAEIDAALDEVWNA